MSLSYDTCPNGIGRLCTLADAAGTTASSYNARGNLLTQTITIGTVVHSISYAYNGADQLTQITYPSGRTVDYPRNALGQVEALNTTLASATTPVVSALAYQPFWAGVSVNMVKVPKTPN